MLGIIRTCQTFMQLRKGAKAFTHDVVNCHTQALHQNEIETRKTGSVLDQIEPMLALLQQA